MRCPQCNKFAALSMEEPEIQSENFDESTGEWDAEVRIVRKSDCCGEEMKEATFQFDGELPEEIKKKHKGKKHELSAEFYADGTEEGGHRYKKSFYGAELTITFKCKCQIKPIHVHTASDNIQASGMDEMA